MHIHRLIYTLSLLFILFSCSSPKETQEQDPEVPQLPPIGFYEEEFSKEEGKVKSGENFTGILLKLGITQTQAYDMTQVCDSIFDVRKMRAGKTWKAYYKVDTLENQQVSKQLNYLVYENDIVTSTVFRFADSLAAWTYSKPVDVVKKYADVTMFIVREGLMDRRTLAKVDELYDEGTYKKFGIILNGTKYVSGKYGRYRYGYSYGYGNGSVYGYHKE